MPACAGMTSEGCCVNLQRFGQHLFHIIMRRHILPCSGGEGGTVSRRQSNCAMDGVSQRSGIIGRDQPAGFVMDDGLACGTQISGDHRHFHSLRLHRHAAKAFGHQ